jgi:hypothetical protein
MAQRLLVGLLALAVVVCAQRRVDPRNLYHRVVCVVPMTRQGTVEDALRPLHAPWPPSDKPNPKGILGFSHVVSDDGRFAIVEFLASDPAAFAPLLNDKLINAFQHGVEKRTT